MTGFELWTSDARSNCSTNSAATTTAQPKCIVTLGNFFLFSGVCQFCWPPDEKQ